MSYFQTREDRYTSGDGKRGLNNPLSNGVQGRSEMSSILYPDQEAIRPQPSSVLPTMHVNSDLTDDRQAEDKMEWKRALQKEREDYYVNKQNDAFEASQHRTLVKRNFQERSSGYNIITQAYENNQAGIDLQQLDNENSSMRDNKNRGFVRPTNNIFG